VTRTKKDGTPEGGWLPEEAVSVEEALRAYTIWPARSSGLESHTGTLEAGKWADITVMDIDPFNTPVDRLMEGRILMTLVDGKVRYEAE